MELKIGKAINTIAIVTLLSSSMVVSANANWITKGVSKLISKASVHGEKVTKTVNQNKGMIATGVVAYSVGEALADPVVKDSGVIINMPDHECNIKYFPDDKPGDCYNITEKGKTINMPNVTTAEDAK